MDINNNNQKLFNDFMLNEIKAKEDALRQLLAVNALLIGAYSTILLSILLKVFDIIRVLPQHRITFNITILAELLIIAIIIISPVNFWVDSIENILRGLEQSNLASVLLDPRNSSNALVEINNTKQLVLSKCYNRTDLGVVIVMFFILLSVLIMIVYIYSVLP